MPSTDFHSERFLFCPTLCQTRCHEDKSAQETPPYSLISYEEWDSLIGWQLTPNRTLGGEDGKGSWGGGRLHSGAHQGKKANSTTSWRIPMRWGLIWQWKSSCRNLNLQEQALGNLSFFQVNPSCDIMYQSDYFQMAGMLLFLSVLYYIPIDFIQYYIRVFVYNWFFFFKSQLGGSSLPLGKANLLSMAHEAPPPLLISSLSPHPNLATLFILSAGPHSQCLCPFSQLCLEQLPSSWSSALAVSADPGLQAF